MHPILRHKILLPVLCLLSIANMGMAASFKVEDIRVEGLQRISAGTVFNYLPVKPGDTLDDAGVAQVIRALFQTGFFKDVQLERVGGVLTIVVVERPAISSIDITGNKSIEEDDLKQGLKDIGMAEGRTFNRSVLDTIEQELRRQFYNQGKYDVRLSTEVTPLERNRVAISIFIVEGETAKIKKINIVGNKSFPDDELMDDFQSSVGGWLSFFTKEDQYSRQKLTGDLETLRSFYLDRGYIKFAVDSTQVAISPDKQDIYITINVTEGDVYTISDIKLTGDLVLDAELYFPLIQLRRGEPFSRREVVNSTDRINERLSDQGYAFANVNNIPEVDEENRTVSVTYFVDPGKQVYVRRIDIEGNRRTRDRVIRREMRQMESARLSNTKILLSRERLRRLGFFEDISIETPAVPGSTDLMDVLVTVKEQPSGSLSGGLGYSETQGVTLSASVREDNFLGTGKRVALTFNNSKYNQHYMLSYNNPYATVNGISRGFTFSYQETDYEELNISDYQTDTSLASVNFGLPLSDFNRVNAGFALEYIKFQPGTAPSEEIEEFVEREGDTFLDFKLTTSWRHDSRDSAIFPTRGVSQRFLADFTIPGSDLQFYRLSYNYREFIPLYKDYIFSYRGDIGYADGYGKTEELPFFENFFAGGEKTVRGFKTNTLGPRDSYDDPLGGNIKLVGSVELFAPPPFGDLQETLRMSTFLDFGNVFDSTVEFDEFRYSVGVGVTWMSPMGAMTMSYGIPLNEQDGDDIENFQFSFGQVF